jgi:hypothetical protein
VSQGPSRPGEGRPFGTAEQAWYWTMAALLRRQDGGGIGGDRRWICTPDDILTALDELYRDMKISPSQAAILRDYGKQMGPPQPRTEHYALWRDAMVKLQGKLIALGIVVPRVRVPE